MEDCTKELHSLLQEEVVPYLFVFLKNIVTFLPFKRDWQVQHCLFLPTSKISQGQ
jgi:hypothetical protein